MSSGDQLSPDYDELYRLRSEVAELEARQKSMMEQLEYTAGVADDLQTKLNAALADAERLAKEGHVWVQEATKNIQTERDSLRSKVAELEARNKELEAIEWVQPVFVGSPPHLIRFDKAAVGGRHPLEWIPLERATKAGADTLRSWCRKAMGALEWLTSKLDAVKTEVDDAAETDALWEDVQLHAENARAVLSEGKGMGLERET